jgi:malate dehydrogenase (oxaloacetate-decarboxylating)
VERALQEQLDIPVFHDDQHGTAVVVLAALLNAVKLTRQSLERLRIVVSGAGAAGAAVTRILLRAGARDVIVCDREGILHEGRLPNLNESKAWLARNTNPRKLAGRCQDALRGANVFIGVSGPGTIEARHLKRMAARPIIFALANPIPEIMPEEAGRIAFIMATGRSDYPNQINNVLAFPGIFRGALDVRARQITESMKLASARAIASCIAPRELSPEYIVPSVFNRDVVQCVAEAVKRAAIKAGVARKRS